MNHRRTTPNFGRVLWTMMRTQPWRYTLALVIWTLIWTMPVLVGLIIAYFFDQLDAGIEPSTVRFVVLATLAYAVVRTALIFVGMRNHASLLFRAAGMMRRNLLLRLYELPGAEPLEETPGEVVSRFRDDVDHVIEPFDLTVDLVGALTAGTVAFAILFSIDPIMAIVISIPVIVVAVAANRTGGLVRRYRREARAATEAITGYLGETFSATQSVKVAGAEETMMRRFRGLNAVRKEMMVRDRTLTETMHAVFRNTINIGTGLILLMAAGRLSATGEAGISIGQFALFVFLLEYVSDASYFIGVFIARAKQGSVSVDRLTASLHGEPWRRVFEPTDLHVDGPVPEVDIAERKVEPFRRLEVRGLTYHYPGSANGIENVDLDIDAGEFVVVTGKIGSGKTTLLRAVLGLLPMGSGSIVWNDEAVETPERAMVPPRSAYTPQVPKLFSMTLEDNLVLGEDVSDHTLDESIYIATMRHDIDLMPDGLETMIGPRGVRLSGGQVQRSASARMLTRESHLLVLDDVSSALDVETEQVLWTRLFNARRNVAALVVSHRQVALARADRVVVMHGGRVVASGTADELQATSPHFRAIWEGVREPVSRA